MKAKTNNDVDVGDRRVSLNNLVVVIPIYLLILRKTVYFGTVDVEMDGRGIKIYIFIISTKVQYINAFLPTNRHYRLLHFYTMTSFSCLFYPLIFPGNFYPHIFWTKTF